jgi:hypothetical protein
LVASPHLDPSILLSIGFERPLAPLIGFIFPICCLYENKVQIIEVYIAFLMLIYLACNLHRIVSRLYSSHHTGDHI